MFVALVILVLFGSKKLPELLGGLGTGIRNFKKNLQEPEQNNEKQKKIDDKDHSDSAQ
ncbi:MAG: twin-arginine translocase TatA/TatE family subunit [Bdellovibrionales bacterium]|nr:twin-arginine translocase TatA/TatE family subunit [Bdellovibrionales bacterium]